MIKILAAISAGVSSAYAWRIVRVVLSGTHPVAILAAVSVAAFAFAAVLAVIGGAAALFGRRESDDLCAAAEVAGVVGLGAGFWPAIAIIMA